MTTLTVPVKPYIKKYLENNYGSPVNFSGVRGLNDLLCLLLEKQSYHHDKQITLNLYSATVTIVVTRDIFYRHGWSFSKTSIIRFNAFMEFIIKIRQRDIVRVKTTDANKKISCSIRQFQLEFDFSEDNYSYDAIIKDLQRNTNIRKNNKKNIGQSVHEKLQLCLEE